MPQQATTREVNLLKLEPFCRSLLEALRRHGVESDKALELLRVAATGECVRCGQKISGEELFALSQSPTPEFASAKLGRLRLGDCARSGCNSYFYRLTFQPRPPLDWAALVAEAETIGQEAPTADLSWLRAVEVWMQLATVKRAITAIVILVLFIALRQWYFGGSIPIVHQPEKFQIQVDPNHANEE